MLVYKHKVTGERVILRKLTPSLWVEDREDKKKFYKYKDLQNYVFLKKESMTGGWKSERRIFLPKQ